MLKKIARRLRSLLTGLLHGNGAGSLGRVTTGGTGNTAPEARTEMNVPR